MPRGVSSAGELWPTTIRSGRLRKRRAKASRIRRFSINKNARIDGLGAQSAIDDLTSVRNTRKKNDGIANERNPGHQRLAQESKLRHTCMSMIKSSTSYNPKNWMYASLHL